MAVPDEQLVTFSHIFHSVRRRYSLVRSYENAFVRTMSLSGCGIDLGAKSADAKYYAYLDMSKVDSMHFVDYFHSGPNIIRANLEQDLPIDDGQYDFVLAFNVMEHLFNTNEFLSEAHRILKPNGRFHGLVPFLLHYHADPNDYFRFTGQALAKLLENAGFGSIEVAPLCFGPFKAAATQLSPVLRFWPLRLLAYCVAITLDKIHSRLSKGAETFAVAYYFSGARRGAPH